MTLQTLAGQEFMAVNGIQTLSDKFQNLMSDLPTLTALGVKALRISPHSRNTPEIIRLFDDLLQGRRTVEEAQSKVASYYPEMSFANGFLHGKAGMDLVAAS